VEFASVVCVQHAHQFLHPSAWALVKMMLTLFFVAHSLGCMWHWMATLNSTGINWTSKYGIDVSYGLTFTSWMYIKL
jgi:hypothetical protein